MMSQAAGYGSPAYARVFAEHGAPLHLSCGGSLIVRRIPGSQWRDAMGCYPLFACADWHSLPAALEQARADLVSVVLVTDPFAGVLPEFLRSCFDRVVPFKSHFVADLDRPLDTFVSRSRLRAAQRALETVDVEVVRNPNEHAEDWFSLQKALQQRHGVRAIKLLSREAFAALMEVPGLVMLRAFAAGRTLGMHLELIQGDVVYGHLAAYSEEGRVKGAAAALHWWELQHFRGQARYLDWGGEAGLATQVTGGLGNFKQGFSSETRQTYLCCRIWRSVEYATLVRQTGTEKTAYFPAYRNGELV
jgi:hypothetical protein